MSNRIDKGMTFCTCITTYWTYAHKIPICVYVYACDSNSAITFFLLVAFLLQFYLATAFFYLEEIWADILHCSSAVEDAAGVLFGKAMIFLSLHSNYNVIALIQLTSLGK